MERSLETMGYAVETDHWKDKKGREIFLKTIPRALFMLPSGKVVELLNDSYNRGRYLARGFKPIAEMPKNEAPQADAAEPPAAPEVKAAKALSPKRKVKRQRKRSKEKNYGISK